MANFKEYNSITKGPAWKERGQGRGGAQISSIFVLPNPPQFIPSPTQTPKAKDEFFTYEGNNSGEAGATLAYLAIGAGTVATAALAFARCTPAPIAAPAPAGEADILKLPSKPIVPEITPQAVVPSVPIWPSPAATLEPTELSAPTPSPTEAAVATARPTLTATETIAGQLKTISFVPPVQAESSVPAAMPVGTEWKVVNGEIQLVTISGNPAKIATYDQKTGTVVAEPAFAPTFRQMAEDTLSPNNKIVVDFVKGNGPLILPYDRIDNKPAAIVMLDATGNYKTIQGSSAVANFVPDTQTGKILAQFSDKTGYYYVNSDGTLDYAPLAQVAEQWAQRVRIDNGFTPDQQNQIRGAIYAIVNSKIWGVSADEIMAMTGDTGFRAIWNERFKNNPGADFDTVWKSVRLNSPADLFSTLTAIRPKSMPATFSWAYLREGRFVNIGEAGLSRSNAYIIGAIFKEAVGARCGYLLDRYFGFDDYDQGSAGERMSFFYEAALIKLLGAYDSDLGNSVTDSHTDGYNINGTPRVRSSK